MKILKYISWAVLLLYIQVLVAPRLAIGGAEPSFLMPFIIFCSFMISGTPSLWLAFILGMSLDILQPSLFGMHTFIFIIISFLVNRASPNINKKQVALIAMSIVTINVVYSLLHLFTYFLLSEIKLDFILNLTGSFFYNSVFSFVMIYIMVFLDKLHFTLHD